VDLTGQNREVPELKPEVSQNEKEQHHPDRCRRCHPDPWRRHVRGRRKGRLHLLQTGPGLLPGKASLLQVTRSTAGQGAGSRPLSYKFRPHRLLLLFPSRFYRQVFRGLLRRPREETLEQCGKEHQPWYELEDDDQRGKPEKENDQNRASFHYATVSCKGRRNRGQYQYYCSHKGSHGILLLSLGCGVCSSYTTGDFGLNIEQGHSKECFIHH